jgi:serine/threonine protein phosphatase 1
VPANIPWEDRDFLNRCRLLFETEQHFFVHGNYLADLPFESQPRQVLLWDSLKRRQPGRHISGKTGILGHSAQKSGEILDLGYVKCIDTCCYGDGWLTALEVLSGQVWQANKAGSLRP